MEKDVEQPWGQRWKAGPQCQQCCSQVVVMRRETSTDQRWTKHSFAALQHLLTIEAGPRLE